MKKRNILILVTLLVFLFTLTGCSNNKKSVAQEANTADTWSSIKKRGRVIIGLDDTFVPMGFREKNGQLVGYDIDLAKAVFKQYGIKADFQPIDWNMKETELRNRTIDLIWNGYTITPARKKQLMFSRPYMANRQVLVTKTKENITSFKGMQGKTLGAQTSSSGASLLNEHPTMLKDYIKGKTPVLYDSFNNALMDLDDGRIQGLLIDSVYAGYYISKEKDPTSYRITRGGFDGEDFAAGMRKGDKTLKSKIDQGLQHLANTGELQRINRKWFGNSDNSLIQPAK
ncbi:amino acid ABC transporter substrate-binding protein [Companilactobacillus crustorum]|uniref:Glutamine ABC transporter substrate binding component n=3 Tax=Companilactobacillus TaxID=2767879 RepID=A0A837RGG4_9LACO|nr:amino acid ABC transporter substrate-binding protein [Companilactobacillus crustorum]KRK42312.1 glutamine ABC transporter substrate binding component [Companilactobacillus crustorum JCM 15951]KRO20260.1 glutamine ABC transporter substrate binding component [Companilactobacillus crustorum]GEO76694.1 amino acid ABC transporter substrate-binding protein [Companilactobacillus crustorum]